MNADIEFHIRENYPFSKLPANIRQLLGDSQREYEKQVVVFSIRNQLRYKGNLVRTVKKDEKRYYEELLQYSREHLMLFPYHLSDVVVKGMRVTPFQYYCNILQDLMEQERSYDSLPNFTAADCLRLLGVGRNQYIDLMNQCRSAKKFFRRKPIRELLPSKPVSVNIEAWWIVQVGYITEDDIKLVQETEKHIIDQIIDDGPARAGDFNAKDVYSLYRKGLIYLDVRISDDDFIIVPPLEGFVMNRVLGDYFETLLYKIFVSIDEHTPVKELASVLQIDLQLVKNAVSMYCRLGFARLKTQDLEFAETHPSWIYYQHNTTKNKIDEALSTEDPVLVDWNVGIEKINTESATPSESLSAEESDPVTVNSAGHTKKIAFLFDSTLTAYLMMGNLSPGLKSHAVTMFEVGKLPDESLDSLIQELDKIADVGEGEAQRYFDHALTLHSTILFLRHNRLLNPDSDGTSSSVLGLDLIRCESLQSLDAATCSRLLNKNYALLVSMAPLSNEIRPVTSCSPPHVGPAIPEVNSVWFKLFIYYLTKSGPPSLLLVKGTRLRKLPKMFQKFEKLLVTTWGHDPGVVLTSNVLLTLNDALTHSAVLVQGYSLSNEGKIVYQSFPFEDNEREGLRTPLCSHPAIKSLSEHVDLKHSCGYVTMLNSHHGSEMQHQMVQSRGSPSMPVNGFKDDSSPFVLAAELDALDLAEKKNEAPTSESCTASVNEINAKSTIPECKNENWVLLDCCFGIPLFDAALNKDVCHRIASHSLCSRSNLQELTQFNRRLALHLLCFIAELQGTKPLLEIPLDGTVASLDDKTLEFDLPFPVHNFSFCNGFLQRVENWSEC